MKNTRLWEAVQVLVAGEKDARHRVADACSILEKMHKTELRPDLAERLQNILSEAGKSGPVCDEAGNVTLNRYDNTIILRKNATYARLAKANFFTALPITYINASMKQRKMNATHKRQ
jgi:hypothetical protein